MTTPDVPAPFASVDEAVGALLDGELGDAAAEAGVPVDELEVQIRALPDFASTAAAMTGARDALSKPEPLTQIARFRLMSRAIRAVTPERGEHKGRRAVMIGAAAAAVVVLLLGSAALISSLSGGGGSGANSSSSASGSGVPNFGDVTNAETLRGKVQGESAPTGAPALATGGATDSAEFTKCRTSLSSDGFPDPAPLGTATYEDKPALVYETNANGRRIVLVVDAATCTLRVAQSF